MATLIIIHEVENYQEWRAVYDSKSSLADAFGRESASIYRNTDDPDQVVVIETYAGSDGIRELVANRELKAAMEEAGVKGTPTLHIVD